MRDAAEGFVLGIPSPVWTIAAHLALVGSVLFAAAWAYRRPTGISGALADRRRVRWLRVIGPAWGAALLAAVGVSWWLRLGVWVPALAAQHPGAGVWVGVAAGATLEALLLGYWLVYVGHAWRGVARYAPPPAVPLAAWPRCLVLLPVCDEERAVMERSMASAAALEGMARAVVVDNSRTAAGREAAAEVAARHGLERILLANRGHKACALNDALSVLGDYAPVIAVLDADQRVRPDFLLQVAPALLAAPDLAFVQTPQNYEDAQRSRLSRAAAQQEMLLYDAILASFSVLGRVPLCGSNFVMRRAALDTIGGFDEACLSEDLATGHNLHVAGWRSVYLRESLALGLAPVDLAAYWRQQCRWATGNTQHLLRLLAAPGRGGWALWAGAAWSSAFYLMACVIGVLAALPVLALAVDALRGGGAGIGPLGWLGLSLVPLYALVVLFPYVNMALRGYALRDLVLLQGLLAVTVPRYVVAVLRGVLGQRVRFRGTRHGASGPQRWTPGVGWLLLVVAGAAALVLAVRRPEVTAWWVVWAWLSASAVSLGHLPFFVLPERNAGSTLKPAGASDIPPLRSASTSK